MEGWITNSSHNVPVMNFDNFEAFTKWTSNNNITTYTNSFIVGYTRITLEIVIKTTSDRYFVVERFDDKKCIFSEGILVYSIIQDQENTKYGIVANTVIKPVYNEYASNRFSDGIAYEIELVDYGITKRNYIPSIKSISYYVVVCKDASLRSIIEGGNKPYIAQSKMSKQKFDELKTKLNMLGIKYKLVDLNTIVVLTNNGTPLYTRQKGIKVRYDSDVFI
jgi:hypothetical protein